MLAPGSDATQPSTGAGPLSRSRSGQVRSDWSLLGVALASAVLMFAFETAKQFLFPHIAIWQSHFATIGFVSILSGLTAYILGKRIQSLDADSQGTSSVLYGEDLKPELCGLFPESVLSALNGFFVAAVKDTLVVGFPSAEQMVNNPSELVSRGGDCLGFAEFPSDAPKELTEIIFGMMQRVGRHA